VAVVLIAALSLGGAAVTHSWAALLGLSFLIPTCGLYLFADGRLLQEWRGGLLARWVDKEIDFAALRGAVRAVPALPAEVLNGILATLPTPGELAEEQRVVTPTRRAVAAAYQLTYRRRQEALLLKTGASLVTVGSIAAAVWLRSWGPLTGLVSLCAVPAAAALIRRRNAVKASRAVHDVGSSHEFSEHDYARLTIDLR
jgi:uncharacterized membrane protein